MNVLTMESEPLNIGVILAHAVANYPGIKILQMSTTSNVRVNSVNQPFQTCVLYLVYSLPGNAEIDQPALMASVQKTADEQKKKADFKAKLMH